MQNSWKTYIHTEDLAAVAKLFQSVAIFQSSDHYTGVYTNKMMRQTLTRHNIQYITRDAWIKRNMKGHI